MFEQQTTDNEFIQTSLSIIVELKKLDVEERHKVGYPFFDFLRKELYSKDVNKEHPMMEDIEHYRQLLVNDLQQVINHIPDINDDYVDVQYIVEQLKGSLDGTNMVPDYVNELPHNYFVEPFNFISLMESNYHMLYKYDNAFNLVYAAIAVYEPYTNKAACKKIYKLIS